MNTPVPAWHSQADCADRPDLDWFSESPAMVAAVKAVCAGCAALSDCRTDALSREDPWGVQGGLSASERLSPMLLADPEPVAHVASRSCYVTNHCQRAECRAANAAYQAELRARAAATGARTIDAGEQLEIGEAAA